MTSTPSPAATADSTGAVLADTVWHAHRSEHRRQVHALIGDYLKARARGVGHPVVDFLFTYYSARPAHILRWHPGYGIALADDRSAAATDLAQTRGYRRSGGVVEVDPDHLADKARLLATSAALLTATAGRPAHLGCFGLHEWAMVHRTTDLRHDLPLRLGTAATDAVVESMPLRCTHFDAFRFFTESAVPRNERTLSPADRAHEQPGCLHATMDLYRLCLRLTPLMDSGLTLRAFALAYAARELDMRASPYDLSDYGYSPVAVETASGRADYVRMQNTIAERGNRLRRELAARCTALSRSVSPRLSRSAAAGPVRDSGAP